MQTVSITQPCIVIITQLFAIRSVCFYMVVSVSTKLAVTKVRSKVAKHFILVMMYVFKFQKPCTTLE